MTEEKKKDELHASEEVSKRILTHLSFRGKLSEPCGSAPHVSMYSEAVHLKRFRRETKPVEVRAAMRVVERQGRRGYPLERA